MESQRALEREIRIGSSAISSTLLLAAIESALVLIALASLGKVF